MLYVYLSTSFKITWKSRYLSCFVYFLLQWLCRSETPILRDCKYNVCFSVGLGPNFRFVELLSVDPWVGWVCRKGLGGSRVTFQSYSLYCTPCCWLTNQNRWRCHHSDFPVTPFVGVSYLCVFGKFYHSSSFISLLFPLDICVKVLKLVILVSTSRPSETISSHVCSAGATIPNNSGVGGAEVQWCCVHCVTRPKIWIITIPRLLTIPNLLRPNPILFRCATGWSCVFFQILSQPIPILIPNFTKPCFNQTNPRLFRPNPRLFYCNFF